METLGNLFDYAQKSLWTLVYMVGFGPCIVLSSDLFKAASTWKSLDVRIVLTYLQVIGSGQFDFMVHTCYKFHFPTTSRSNSNGSSWKLELQGSSQLPSFNFQQSLIFTFVYTHICMYIG